jgi:Tfp pilus assembly protein PilX
MRTPLGGEQGIALVIAVMSMMLMAALGSALVLTTMTEAGVASNYASGVEAFYAAEAEVERTLADLPGTADWQSLIGLRADRATTPRVRVVVTVAAAANDGQIVIRAQAYGPRNVDRTVEATVAHTDEVGPASVRLVAWREVR